MQFIFPALVPEIFPLVKTLPRAKGKTVTYILFHDFWLTYFYIKHLNYLEFLSAYGVRKKFKFIFFQPVAGGNKL